MDHRRLTSHVLDEDTDTVNAHMFFLSSCFFGYLLQSCRDGDDFLDGTTQALYVITPVKYLERPTAESVVRWSA